MIETREWKKSPPFGAGSPFKPNGLNDPFSNQSATNPFATDSPRLYDQQGHYRGKLSANPAVLSGSFGSSG